METYTDPNSVLFKALRAVRYRPMCIDAINTTHQGYTSCPPSISSQLFHSVCLLLVSSNQLESNTNTAAWLRTHCKMNWPQGSSVHWDDHTAMDNKCSLAFIMHVAASFAPHSRSGQPHEVRDPHEHREHHEQACHGLCRPCRPCRGIPGSDGCGFSASCRLPWSAYGLCVECWLFCFTVVVDWMRSPSPHRQIVGTPLQKTTNMDWFVLLPDKGRRHQALDTDTLCALRGWFRLVSDKVGVSTLATECSSVAYNTSRDARASGGATGNEQHRRLLVEWGTKTTVAFTPVATASSKVCVAQRKRNNTLKTHIHQSMLPAVRHYVHMSVQTPDDTTLPLFRHGTMLHIDTNVVLFPSLC